MAPAGIEKTMGDLSARCVPEQKIQFTAFVLEILLKFENKLDFEREEVYTIS